MPAGAGGGERSYAEWQKLGVTRADGQPFTHPDAQREALGAGRRAGRRS